MDTTLLTRVKSKLFVHSRRRSRNLLEGEFASVFHGRSLDYDDLRDYVPGDEVRDIDWKATARHTSPLVRRYVATRKQNLMLVIDTGRGMAAGVARRAEEERGNRRRRARGLPRPTARRPRRSRRGDATSTVAHPMRERGPPRAAPARDRRCDDPGRRAEQPDDNCSGSCATCVDGCSCSSSPTTWSWTGSQRSPARLHVQHEILWITVEDADPTSIDAARDRRRG